MTLDEVRNATGPVLSDGTALSELIDPTYREVSLRVLHDPEIYRLELKNLFAKAWIAVAHEDEIPNAFDYVLRYVGEDQVIISRGEDGSVTAALNVCTHRASKVCRFEVGNARTFQCPYHGWAYKADGSFLGSPIGRETMHGTLRRKDELDLRRGRVEIYAGMIFVAFSDEAPTLTEFLGPMTWYYDLMLKRGSGTTVVGHPQRFTIKANWKCAAEQFAGDIFHTLTLHRSLREEQVISDGDAGEALMPGVSSGWQGHWIRCFDITKDHWVNALKGSGAEATTDMDKMRRIPPAGISAEMVESLPDRFGEDQLHILANYPPLLGQAFPNLGLLLQPFQTPDGQASAFCTIRIWLPKGPDHFELIHFSVVEKDAPKELQASVSFLTSLAFGASGFVEVDDTDTWPMQSQAARGALGEHAKLRYQAITGENKPADWPGPGHIYAGFPKDDTQWNWWVRYTEFMEGRPW
ncbi:aromatic ring-hydroxylating oxygenase subunit alpha [Mycolicibacterium sphagni]|uniref:aromatic ring-hydroxylating oxygenase subunit alpha n=1 Tax=Mycolicibacterium sphagni TaxID=1786 RepID=UPI0021F398F4|nr:Rieske 2Fe-2S domain-containing protein [Mycolicibacterium sphagni]